MKRTLTLPSMNLPPNHPPLTPPRRGTIHCALLPSLEGLGVGSGVRFAYVGPWNLSPSEGERVAAGRVRGE